MISVGEQQKGYGVGQNLRGYEQIYRLEVSCSSERCQNTKLQRVEGHKTIA